MNSHILLTIEKFNVEKKFKRKRRKLVVVFDDIAAFYFDRVQFILV